MTPVVQQTVVKPKKEYSFTMSKTEINTWTANEQGIIVSGTTTFTMNIDANISGGVASASTHTVPDFSQTLTGIMILDANAPVVELRKVPLEDAKLLIHQYLKQHPGSRTSDLIIELALEPDIVIEALSQLRCEGKVEGKDVGNK